MKNKGIKTAAIAIAIMMGVMLALPHLVDMDRFRPQLESSLATSLGREVHLGHMELSLLAGGAKVDQISVADDPAFGTGDFLQAKSLGVGVSWISLIFSHSLHVTSLNVEQPQVSLIQSAQGKWNFATLGAAAGAEQPNSTANQFAEPAKRELVLDHLKISKATLQVTSSGHQGHPVAFREIDADMKNVSLESAMSFVLSAHTTAGKIEVRGEAGPLNHSDSDQIPFHAAITSGMGAANVSGTYEMAAENSAVHMKIAGDHVPLDSVVGILPALGVSLPAGSKLHGGTVNANLSVDGPLDHLSTSGNVQIANAHLSGFDLGSKLSSLPGLGSMKSGPELSIVSLGSQLHISPKGTRIGNLNGHFAGIGTITGGGEIGADNHLQLKMDAKIAGDGVLRFGLNHVGLKNVPDDIPFQVIGTTSEPIVIPDLSGMAKNSTKIAAASAGKKLVQKAVNGDTKKSKGKPAVVANNKKGGFLHGLFHHKGSKEQ
ncbi:MAG TPA: AsmA family protein [Candidatus Sulfotelmatobacter sp.]|nr:AsmA family protein [Candidatus Sulfotelmatobacter sp.]